MVVPPLHSEVITATLKARTCARPRRSSRMRCRTLDSLYAPNPAGLAVTVAWGVPYFEGYVAAQAKIHLPHDRRADKPALLPTRTFPSDPKATLLERERRRRSAAQRPAHAHRRGPQGPLPRPLAVPHDEHPARVRRRRLRGRPEPAEEARDGGRRRRRRPDSRIRRSCSSASRRRRRRASAPA